MACASLLCVPAVAQQRRKQKTPRALALVEWPPKGQPRLVPIALLIDGRFYDASIYMADPVPMALEYGTVYEVEKSGDPLGFATVGGALDASGHWLGVAKYQTKAAVLAASTKKTAPAVRKDPEEGPPRLTKGGDKKPAAPPQAEPAPAQSKQKPDSSGDGPPRLQKPQESETKEAANPPAPTEAAPKKEEDADLAGRPRLRRGKPVETSAESAPAPQSARVSTTVAPGKTPAQPASSVRILPAISDAGGPEPTSYLMPGSETVPASMVSGMQDLARAALQKYADAHGGAHAGPLQDIDVRAFDLSLVSQATVVLTATAHPAPPEPAAHPSARTRRGKREPEPPAQPVDTSLTYWITVVARENYNGDLRQLKVWATDDKHLDAYPRMELIDAVDADGDGRGELL
ncbi:MAG: hypothetical protein ACRD3E_13250, partial [Terriglobales bacterium]